MSVFVLMFCVTIIMCAVEFEIDRKKTHQQRKRVRDWEESTYCALPFSSSTSLFWFFFASLPFTCIQCLFCRVKWKKWILLPFFFFPSLPLPCFFRFSFFLSSLRLSVLFDSTSSLLGFACLDWMSKRISTGVKRKQKVKETNGIVLIEGEMGQGEDNESSLAARVNANVSRVHWVLVNHIVGPTDQWVYLCMLQAPPLSAETNPRRHHWSLQ